MKTHMIHCNSEIRAYAWMVTNNEYRNTENSRSCWHNDCMSKENLHFCKVNKLFPFFCCGIFKRIYVPWVSNRKSCGNICLLLFTPHFLFSQTPICVFSCSIETLLFIQTNVNLSTVKTIKLILLWDVMYRL